MLRSRPEAARGGNPGAMSRARIAFRAPQSAQTGDAERGEWD